VKNVVKVNTLFAIEVPKVGVFNKFNLTNFKNKIEVDSLSINYREPFRKVYLSRTKANRRRISNELELVKLLSAFDIEIYYAEDLELSSLIRILSETKFLISNHGAGLSNIIHLQPGQTILELKSDNDNYWMYFSLSRILDHKYYYLFAKGDSINYRDSNIEVNLQSLELLLKEIV
jgi:capsular polysaccharide biosynthesis protein